MAGDGNVQSFCKCELECKRECRDSGIAGKDDVRASKGGHGWECGSGIGFERCRQGLVPSAAAFGSDGACMDWMLGCCLRVFLFFSRLRRLAVGLWRSKHRQFIHATSMVSSVFPLIVVVGGEQPPTRT